MIEVRAERPYHVHIEHGAIGRLPELVTDADQVAILFPPTMADTARRVAESLTALPLLLEVPDAETAKTPEVLVRCWNDLAAAGFTRSDVVIGLGGGTSTDLAGFVAASWLRGVRYISVPTTVLAMVDAAVGGKTGINLDAGKNLVGAFHEPIAVLCDLDFLATLPPADLRAGMAEVAKCGFIADPAILGLIEEDPADALRPDAPRLAELITRGIQVKADVVSADLRETTSVGAKVGREVLNYGHTLGHAIERHEGYQWRHGDAISVGMVFVAELSNLLGRMPADLVEQHRRVLGTLGLPTTYRADAWPALRAAMNLDKKTRGATLRLVILDELAAPSVLVSPDEAALQEAYRKISG
ncbi:3-dehydroquinate synthase [Enemella sp. A6]|uniref:3-dehydroquinate synthase n=1 Tax=Enemella sp. A6 TaxID=3440152 RepID=UPI003EBAB8D3